MQKALQKGYKVLQIYEVSHFHEVAVYDPDTNEGGLFAGYVNAFLKMKQEANRTSRNISTSDATSRKKVFTWNGMLSSLC